MKIACFLFDPNIGGPHVRAAGVYSILRLRGFEPVIVLPELEGSAYGYFTSQNIVAKKVAFTKPVSPTRGLRFLKYIAMVPNSVHRIVNFLKKGDYDLVHVNGAADICPVLAAKLCKIPVVWHLNDTALPKVVARLFAKIIKSLSDRVVIAAKAVGEHYGLKEGDSLVLYAPVNIKSFPARKLKMSPSDGDTISIGVLGNWNWIKGQDRFLDLIDLLLERNYKVRAVIIGGFPEKQSNFWAPLLKKIEYSALSNVVDVVGFIRDPRDYLDGLDILVLTSRSEACPISVLEGMAIGIPQVAFKVGGVDEMLNRETDAISGLVVPEGDVEAMADAIGDLLSDRRLFLKVQANGQKVAREIFSLDLCAERHSQLYKEVRVM